MGVSTIGDRIRLRDACQKKVEENSASTSQAGTSTSIATAAQEERVSIFHPRRYNNRNETHASARNSSTRSKSAAKRNPWTPTFLCLADSTSSKAPSSFDKQILFKAGLGVKKIKLDLEDNEQRVLDKITSDTKEASGNPLGFPQLKSCGGFEMLRCSPNCRDLVEIDSCWSAKDLRSSMGGGQGKVYLRPIQKSLSTKPLVQQRHSDVKEKCHMCDQEILVRNLREHLYTCTVGLYSDDGDDTSSTTVSGTPSTSAVSGNTSSTHHQPQQFLEIPAVRHPPYQFLEIPALHHQSQQFLEIPEVHQPSSAVSGNTSSTSSTSAVSGNTSITNNANSDGTTMTSNEAPQALAVPYVDLTEETSNRHQSLNTVEEVVQATVMYCKANNADNTEILCCFQQHFVRGRALDIVSEAEVNEGETNFIIVDRQNLIETAFDEIMTIHEYRTTLQVQFYGKVCTEGLATEHMYY